MINVVEAQKKRAERERSQMENWWRDKLRKVMTLDGRNDHKLIGKVQFLVFLTKRNW
jgi:hypothetical protein